MELDWDRPKACGRSSTCTPLEATVAQSGNYVTCHRRESASSSNNSSSGRSEVAWLRCCCLLCMKLAWERCSGAGGCPVRAVESHPRCLSTLSHAHMHTHAAQNSSNLATTEISMAPDFDFVAAKWIALKLHERRQPRGLICGPRGYRRKGYTAAFRGFRAELLLSGTVAFAGGSAASSGSRSCGSKEESCFGSGGGQ